MDQANRSLDTACVTVYSVAISKARSPRGPSNTPSTGGDSGVLNRKPTRREIYFDRKAQGLCTVCGSEAADGIQMCTEHHEAQLESNRESKRRLRAERRDQDQCAHCGKPSDQYRCPACTFKLGRITAPTQGGFSGVLNDKRSRVRAQTRDDIHGDGYARTRYHGQGKRGRRSVETIDQEDLRDAEKSLRLGVEGLAYFHTNEVKLLPRIQRDDVKNQALAKLVEAGRWVTEVIKRHGYEVPIVVDEDDE